MENETKMITEAEELMEALCEEKELELLDGCSALEEITIPTRIEAIDEGAFAGCSGLKTIHYEGTVEQWNKLPKGMVWDLEIENCTVVCSDGSVTLN